MKSEKAGSVTSAVEVTTISRHGLWLIVLGTEYFLPFDEFPWFGSASVDAAMDVSLLHGHHLRWERLDVDLELDSLSDLERYPLVHKN